MKQACLCVLFCAGALTAQSAPAANDAALQPRPYVYREIDGQKLNAYVFSPPGEASAKPMAAGG